MQIPPLLSHSPGTGARRAFNEPQFRCSECASGATRWLYTIVQQSAASACSYAKQQYLCLALRDPSCGEASSRLLGMAGTDPSATTKESPSQLARVVGRHARSRSHLTLVTSRRHDDDVAGSSLPAERINQCMLLLLIICVVLAGSMLAVVGYLARE
jgi:hypothetical protein